MRKIRRDQRNIGRENVGRMEERRQITEEMRGESEIKRNLDK